MRAFLTNLSWSEVRSFTVYLFLSLRGDGVRDIFNLKCDLLTCFHHLFGFLFFRNCTKIEIGRKQGSFTFLTIFDSGNRLFGQKYWWARVETVLAGG